MGCIILALVAGTCFGALMLIWFQKAGWHWSLGHLQSESHADVIARFERESWDNVPIQGCFEKRRTNEAFESYIRQRRADLKAEAIDFHYFLNRQDLEGSKTAFNNWKQEFAGRKSTATRSVP